jgi:hypothetical protein
LDHQDKYMAGSQSLGVPDGRIAENLIVSV